MFVQALQIKHEISDFIPYLGAGTVLTCLDPDTDSHSGTADLIESGSNPYRDPNQCFTPELLIARYPFISVISMSLERTLTFV
jgi:hypothetical protein